MNQPDKNSTEQKELTRGVRVIEETFSGETISSTFEKDLSSPDFVRIEKDLIELGFFTPSSKKIRGVKKKVMAVSRDIGGKKVEGELTIIPSAAYGLPITADQDKYLAIKKLQKDIVREVGQLTNPTAISSAQLNRLMGKKTRSGKANKDIEEFLQRMVNTGVRFIAKDPESGEKIDITVHVVDQLISYGQKLPDGTIADKHYIWWSKWLLDQFNNGKLLPSDYEDYKQLKNPITKSLVLLLQIGLFASRQKGVFEKRYDELCQVLSITEYKHLSDIKRKLGPALDELKLRGYISNWHVEETADQKHHKIILHHGDKFYRDQELRTGKREQIPQRNNTKQQIPRGQQQAPPPSRAELTEEQQYYVKLLVARDVDRSVAEKEVVKLPADQPVQDQIDFIDSQVASGTFKNSPGWYITKLRENIAIPADFETSSKKQQRRAAEAVEQKRQHEEALIETLYFEYEETAIQETIAALLPGEYESIREGKRQAWIEAHPGKAFVFESMLDSLVRAEIKKRTAILTLDQFKTQRTGQNSAPQQPQETVLAPTPPLSMAFEDTAVIAPIIASVNIPAPEPERQPEMLVSDNHDTVTSPASNRPLYTYQELIKDLPLQLTAPETTEAGERHETTITIEPIGTSDSLSEPKPPSHNTLPTELL